MPLFTYRSPQRRLGLLAVLAGAGLLFAAVALGILGVVSAGTGGGSVLSAMCGPAGLAAVGALLVVLGGAGLFTSIFGPMSMDDYEGPGDTPIWGHCPRCGWYNEKGASACAQCGRALRPPQ